MRNFGNRPGMLTNNVFDARDILKSKRNNGLHDSHVAIDARRLLSKRNERMPTLDFTIPTKTITNEKRPNIDFTIPTKTISNVKRPNLDFTIPIKTISNDNFAKRNKELSNSSNRTPKDLSSIRNSSRTFSDPKTSQGIFSRSMEHSVPSVNSTRSFDSRSPGPSVSTKRSSIEINESREYEKRQRIDNVEKLKFTVVNEEKPKKPALTTATFNCHKSLISPIQGYRIEVKNLHPQVSVDDVYELFTSLNGDLRSCNLVRPGYAEVVFRTLSDAQKSIEEFHGRELDGKPMNLKLVTPAQEPSAQSVNVAIRDRIAKMQSSRRPAGNTLINKEAIYRSMYLKSSDLLQMPRKPFKFAVTL